jgi:hypothetical protein
MSLPFHGALTYDLMTSRTGGFRFYLADKMNFNDSLRLTIEHQPEANTNVKPIIPPSPFSMLTSRNSKTGKYGLMIPSSKPVPR